MTDGLFQYEGFLTASHALDIAEEQTGNFYKFSLQQWKRHHYDVKTLSSLRKDEIPPNAFATLNKGTRGISRFEPKTKLRDFYFICLQDNRILRAMERDDNMLLLPLLVYIFTHELVHIVRFCNFYQRFEVSARWRQKEEGVVHETTFEILKNLPILQMDYTLDCYQDHRVCDLATL